MNYKKSFLIICLIICLFSFASVCASNVNETIVASDEQSDDLIKLESQKIISTSSSNETDIGIEDNDLVAYKDSKIIKKSDGNILKSNYDTSFTALNDKTYNGGYVSLT